MRDSKKATDSDLKNFERECYATDRSYWFPRCYLWNAFKLGIEKQSISLHSIAKQAGVSRRTMQRMNKGEVPSLKLLCRLFAVPVVAQMIDPDDAFLVTHKVIRESLRCTTRYPLFHMVNVNEEEQSGNMLSLPEFMKRLRVEYLRISMCEVSKRFDYCSKDQIMKIEKDCRRIGIGSICNLFDQYQRAIPELPDNEWGTFATLILRASFPEIATIKLEFLCWKKG